MTEKENDEAIRLILAEEKATTQAEKDIIHLKQIALSIRPYSRWWRWGYLGSLRRAIKILEERRKNNEGRLLADPAALQDRKHAGD